MWVLEIPSTNVAEEGQLKLGAMPALHIFRLPEFMYISNNKNF